MVVQGGFRDVTANMKKHSCYMTTVAQEKAVKNKEKEGINKWQKNKKQAAARPTVQAVPMQVPAEASRRA